MWSRTTRYLVMVGLILFGIFVVYLSRPVLPLLVMAAVLSFLLLPLINLLHHRLHVPRGLAVLLTYLAGLFILGLAFLFLIPAIIDAVEFVINLDYGAWIERGNQATRARLERLQAAEIPFEPLDRAVNDAATSLLESLEGATPALMENGTLSAELVLQQLGSVLVGSFNLLSGVVGSLLSRLVTAIFVVLVSLYISMDAHKLKGGILNVLPAPYRPELNTLLERLHRVWTRYLRGQLILMLVMGVIVWLGLSLLGLPYAWVMGVVAGLLEIVPNLGPILSTIPAIVVALLEGSTVLELSPPLFALVIVLFYVVVQQIENTLIVPRLLGSAVNLHPVIVMAGILAGASVAGLLGALLAIPVIATAKEILAYLYRKAMGIDPFPVEEEERESGEREPREQTARAWLERLRSRSARAASADEASIVRAGAGPPEDRAAPGVDD